MEAIRLPVKPLSANDAWHINKRGHKYKTEEYRIYEREVLGFLEIIPVDLPEGLLYFKANFGVSRTDLDNCEKPLIDILEKAYDFNDKLIDEIHVKKHRVSKGCEYIEFALYPLEDELPMDFANSPRCTRRLLNDMYKGMNN